MKTKTTSWDAAEHLPPASGQRNAGRWLAETIMNEKIAIYGDGTRDDAPAIQAMLDSGTSAVILPIPRLRYAIGTTLKIHSGQTIRLEPTTEIRLLPGSNCAMLMNDPAEEAPHDIYLAGGIWNMDNMNQAPNPLHPEVPSKSAYKHLPFKQYAGIPIDFHGVTRLTVSGLTMRNPTLFAVRLTDVTYFTVENMRFDFQTVNPIYLNLDGIHVNSGCRFGVIRNLQGVCYDDLVAINADEGDYSAPIENIEVDGIFAENCHSAVRLLSVCSRVDNISISNVYGTFYCYTIGITQYFDGKGKRSNFGRLSFSNIFASEGKCAPGYHTPNGFPLISGEGQSDVEYLSISHLHRKEALKTRPTIEIPEGMHVKNLTISNCSQTNETGKEILFLNNSGEIDRLSVRDLYIPEKPVIGGKGRIHAFECDASASFLMRKPEAAEQEER